MLRILFDKTFKTNKMKVKCIFEKSEAIMNLGNKRKEARLTSGWSGCAQRGLAETRGGLIARFRFGHGRTAHPSVRRIRNNNE